jgi:Lrp/AsnC family transcriptional regulator for asnA, asnC and gidA
VRLDEVDLQLIALLREDGRMSTRDLARTLDVAEGTIRSRVRRLEENQVMKVTAVTDFEATGNDLFFMLWIKVEGRPVREVGLDIASLPEVSSVSIVSGVYDLVAAMIARDREHLLRITTDSLAAIEGIHSIESALFLDVLVYKSEWGPFTE